MDLLFLNELLNTHSVSGFEREAGMLFANYLAPYADFIQTDVMGNTYASISNHNKDKNCLKYMIEAHIDEVGFQVIYIDDNGYIYVRRNGGIDEQCVPGSRVIIHTSTGEKIIGVVGKPIKHLTGLNEKDLSLDSLWIDTGLSTKDIKEKVSIGDVVAWDSEVRYLANKRISSKGVDDKVGVFAISQVVKRLFSTRKTPFHVCVAASVQEEVGHRGAIACGYNIEPDIAISIDVDFATDTPNCPKSKFGDVSLGKGVVIHRSIDNTIPLTFEIENIAKAKKIKHQISARPFSVGGTNAIVLQQARGGIKTASLGIPCRYMHSPVELCDLEDIKATIDLTYSIITTLDAKQHVSRQTT